MVLFVKVASRADEACAVASVSLPGEGRRRLCRHARTRPGAASYAELGAPLLETIPHTIGELLSRKSGIDGPAETNLAPSKTASVEGEGEKLLHATQVSLDHTPDGSLGKHRRTSLQPSIQEAGGDINDWRSIIEETKEGLLWRSVTCWRAARYREGCTQTNHPAWQMYGLRAPP
ncbi:hypothetical protein N658DRAFT_269920 [Parathielavia hyrcaniae]|uniref:Uncharacterized protein n=1 Tax=Parathielavia hyrcaniae TaxID=113614 RepID=A0AAN6PY59_9PEZI|nr:hypothetical protein N658DRAFT_269920 [Parathielavia hyrcaniae]